MPYINPKDRAMLEPNIKTYAETAGELNFQITRLITEYLEHRGLNYQTCNDIVGALDGAKVEFQRRVVAPYEDKKIEQNGDVYPDLLF